MEYSNESARLSPKMLSLNLFKRATCNLRERVPREIAKRSRIESFETMEAQRKTLFKVPAAWLRETIEARSNPVYIHLSSAFTLTSAVLRIFVLTYDKESERRGTSWKEWFARRFFHPVHPSRKDNRAEALWIPKTAWRLLCNLYVYIEVEETANRMQEERTIKTQCLLEEPSMLSSCLSLSLSLFLSLLFSRSGEICRVHRALHCRVT